MCVGLGGEERCEGGGAVRDLECWKQESDSESLCVTDQPHVSYLHVHCHLRLDMVVLV